MSEHRQTAPSSRWPEGIAVVLSITALLVSGYSLVAAQRQHQDERATELLDQEADYYTGSFLRNPRLLWLWSEDGGQLSRSYDPPTVEFYNRRVLGDPDRPLTVEPDEDGILPGRDPGSAEPGVSFDRTSWPHGEAGPALPHGAVFSRVRCATCR